MKKGLVAILAVCSLALAGISALAATRSAHPAQAAGEGLPGTGSQGESQVKGDGIDEESGEQGDSEAAEPAEAAGQNESGHQSNSDSDGEFEGEQ